MFSPLPMDMRLHQTICFCAVDLNSTKKFGLLPVGNDKIFLCPINIPRDGITCASPAARQGPGRCRLPRTSFEAARRQPAGGSDAARSQMRCSLAAHAALAVRLGCRPELPVP